MSSLPHEVLLLVISHLSRDELLQCQLTSKHWYKISLALLYTTMDIKSEEKAALYARTISESPELGRYLKNIHFHNIFPQNSRGISFDNYDVLDTVIRHCPNIIRMESTGGVRGEGFRFWTQLMYAATQGQLRKLNYLPQPSSISLRSYIYTALSFKNSLAQLRLHENDFSFGPQLAHLGVYRTLCDQIDQFKNLESLSLTFLSDKQLSYFDGLIDKCQHLKELIFDLATYDFIPLSEPEPAIRPRPDIHTLECNWELVDAESQLEYVMRKFPNLKKLIIAPKSDLDGEALTFSSHILTKFIQYTLSIPYFKIEIGINHTDLLIISTEVMKTKHGFKKLDIMYQAITNTNTLDLSSEGQAGIFFPLDTDVDGEPPHIHFLSKFGGKIRSLNVSMVDGIPDMNGEDSTTIDWLYDILQRCPLIEEITMHILPDLPPSHHILQYPSVKKLTISISEYTNACYPLDCLSLNFPNLYQLSFDLTFVKGYCRKPITIHMPHTSLDLLIWNETNYSFGLFKSIEVYIKLKTDAGTKFYLGVKDSLFPIDSTRFDFYTKYIRFDINCKQLKEFRVKRYTSPESDANLIF